MILFVLFFSNFQTSHAQNSTLDLLTSTPGFQISQGQVPDQTDEAPLPTIIFPTVTPAPTGEWRSPLSDMPLALGEVDHFYFSRPIAVDSVNWPMPDYLYGYHDSETEFPHSGLDYDAPLHTPILAAASGKVVFVGYGLALGKGNPKDPYGLAVVIRHDFSYDGYSLLTVYSHMEKILVTDGQRVKEGDQIGLVGLTGNTSGPHVHFEVRLEKDDLYYVQNPELWVMPLIDYGVFVGSFTDANGFFLTSREVWIKSVSTGENWTVKTYAAQDVTNDPAYKENVVLGDLPVGKYEITYLNNYKYHKFIFTIQPEAITYITFKSNEGFQVGSPRANELTTFNPPNSH
jgi:murein DD-endopeptidase MepM/ murein hydrolase activator NlpD